jgi:hypothetical protein
LIVSNYREINEQLDQRPPATYVNHGTPKPAGLDETQWESVYALLEGITVAADAGSEESVKRLAHAARLIMTNLNVEDER